MEGGQVRALDSFGVTASHLPDCSSFIRIGVTADAEEPYLNRLSQRKPLSVSDICPAKLVTWHPVIPNGSYLLHGPRQILLAGCVLKLLLSS
jgi:hypothetical protein